MSIKNASFIVQCLKSLEILNISQNAFTVPFVSSPNVQQQFHIMFETTARHAAAALKGLFCLQAADLIQPHVSVMVFFPVVGTRG